MTWRPSRISPSRADEGLFIAALFNDRVGPTKQRQRHLQSERLRRSQIDDELELRWLLHRQIAGLFTLENACGEEAGLPVGIKKARSEASKSAGISEFAPLIDRWP